MYHGGGGAPELLLIAPAVEELRGIVIVLLMCEVIVDIVSNVVVSVVPAEERVLVSVHLLVYVVG